MIIYLNNLKRLLRRKGNILFMTVIPAVLISIVAFFSTGGSMIKCGIVDYDNTLLTRALVESLNGKCKISEIKEEDIRGKIFGQFLDMVMIIDRGLTQDIITGKNVKIKTVSLQETNKSMPVSLSIESFMNAAVNIAEEAGGSEDVFYRGINAYQNGLFTVKTHSLDNGSSKKMVKSQMGFLLLGMLFLSSLGAMIMLEDKQNKVHYRILSGPVKVLNYMLQNLLSFFTMSVIQILLIFAFMAGIMGIDFGPGILSMLAVSLVFSLCSVSLGVAINTISRDLKQSALVTSLLLSPLLMLGGAFWPKEFMPELLQKIALFVPVTWAMDAYEKILYGTNLAGVIGELIVILGFTVLFLLLATWKRVDVAK